MLRPRPGCARGTTLPPPSATGAPSRRPHTVLAPTNRTTGQLRSGQARHRNWSRSTSLREDPSSQAAPAAAPCSPATVRRGAPSYLPVAGSS
jgi:hypothetical protein